MVVDILYNNYHKYTLIHRKYAFRKLNGVLNSLFITKIPKECITIIQHYLVPRRRKPRIRIHTIPMIQSEDSDNKIEYALS